MQSTKFNCGAKDKSKAKKSTHVDLLNYFRMQKFFASLVLLVVLQLNIKLLVQEILCKRKMTHSTAGLQNFQFIILLLNVH